MNIYDDGEVNTIGGRVYDPKGIMRTLGGGHAMSQPLIIVVEEVNGQSDGVGGDWREEIKQRDTMVSAEPNL